MRRSEAGYSLVAAAAAMTIMFIMMGVAQTGWKYVMKNAREEELLFRAGQIADACDRYNKKQGTYPVSLDVLVKGKFLRKAYKDPMTTHGRWRFLRPGENPGGFVPPGSGGNAGMPSPKPTPRASTAAFGEGIGPFIGVVSLSKEKSLRIFNSKTSYDQWTFEAGKPRIVGKDNKMVNMPGVPGRNRQPRPDNPPTVR